VLIGILIPTAVVYRQTQYALTEAQRLDTDQVLFITGPAPCTGAFKEGISAIPGVRGIGCSGGLGFGGKGTGAPTRRGPVKDANGAYITTGQLSVSYGFFEFFGLEPIAGRLFSEVHPADAMLADQNAPVQGAVVINEAAARVMGFASPQDAIGKSTSLNQKTAAPSEIIGVVPDFGFDAVHNIVPPAVYFIGHEAYPALWARIAGAGAPETLAAIDKLWKQVGPTRPISRSFLDQRIATFYEDITRQGTLFTVFAVAALVIAALGLFGLAAFAAEHRTKEIGIRKSMGASRRDILALLLWQFAKPVLVANLIAWPIAYYVMRRWLEGFAYHIDLAPWMFLAASGLALTIALVTVTGHALLVARSQPASALRYE
jgi:putative ABC transport system permease protein